jgi:hypothetical protein
LHPIDNQAERQRYAEIGEIQYSKEKMRDALDFIESHPARELRLFWLRFLATWTGFSKPIESFRAAQSRLVKFLILLNTLLALGALAGIVVLIRKRSPYALPVIVFPIVFPAVYYLTRALLRYRLIIDPVVLLLTVVALKQLPLFTSKSADASASPSI